MAAARRELEHGPVFCHHHVETGQVAHDLPKIRHAAPRDERDCDALAPNRGDRFSYRRTEPAVRGDRAVIVECERG